MHLGFVVRTPLMYTLQKKETQHVKKYKLLQIFKILLDTEINITLH